LCVDAALKTDARILTLKVHGKVCMFLCLTLMSPVNQTLSLLAETWSCKWFCK